MKKMKFSKRVAMKCRECGGNSKEVTLCHLFDCPLWPIRFGFTMQNKQYKERMNTAEKHYSKDFEELKGMGIDIADFYKENPISTELGNSSR